MEWQITDPREYFGKRGVIAICVDRQVFGARVETKHGWSISFHTNHLEKHGIYANDKWPQGWRWISIPSTRWKQS